MEISRTAVATGIEDQTFENPKTGAVLETAFIEKDGTKGTDLYLSVTSSSTVPPDLRPASPAAPAASRPQ